MKVLTIVGARPQFMKAAPLSRALRARHHEVLVHTGQHYDDSLSEVFFRELGIPAPDYNLNAGSGRHGEQTARMLEGLERLILDERPDWVLVYGDTNSTLAGALAASKLKQPLAHVEAGVRSYNRWNMPEEVNRVLTDHVSDLLLAPSQAAVENLKREGITCPIEVIGDVMADALYGSLHTARMRPLVTSPPYAVVTCHRPENTDDGKRLAAIVDGLNECPIPVVFPVHPRTRSALKRIHERLGPRICQMEPLGYLDMIRLVDGADFVITDSGGLTREAYLLRKPCISLRQESEWTEIVEAGWCLLAGADRRRMCEGYVWAQGTPPAAHPDFYGDGDAAPRAVAALERHLNDPRDY